MDFTEFTIFDIFIKNEFVYAILSINNEEINENNIKISINSRILKFNSKYIKNGPSEPILIFIYNNPFIKNGDQFQAEVSYKNIVKKINIDYVLNNIYLYNLTITTLFKDDFKLFPIFYNYYKIQGVEHFYMYYNGIITEEIKELFNKPDVTLIEWNFKYFLSGCRYLHHAQIGQIHDALYKYGKYNSKYMIFCDLDEYLNVKNNTLKQFIFENQEINLFGFCNIWSKTIDNKIPNDLPNEIIVGDKYNYGSRSKNIYKTSEYHVVGIHSSMCMRDKNWYVCDNSITNLDMYHFYNWSQPNRIEKTHKLHKIKL
jgi:hypothetical protein